MKVLKKTSRFGFGRAAHHHIVYCNHDAGTAVTSTDAGHSHEVTYDPNTGEYIVQPALDGHTHTLEDYVVKPKKKTEEDSEVIQRVRELFKTAGEIERENFEKAKESEDMYAGKHWDETEKSRLEGLGRAAVTINTIEKNIDQLTGVQRQERTDIRYLPVEGGDQRVADLLNILVKQITNQCFYPREESKAFEDACITGRGNLNLSISFDRDLRGEVLIEKFPYEKVRYGAHEKEDLSDCEYLCKDSWFSLSKLKQLWEDKAEEIERDYEDMLATEPSVGYSGDNYIHGSPIAKMVGDEALVDIAKKEYRVIECWQKLYVKTTVIANPTEGFYFNAYGWDAKDIKAARTIPGFFAIEKNETKFRITKIAGGVVLSDENPADLPIDDFFVIPIYAKKRGCKWWGKVEAAKDAQKYVNKNYSQALDVGNKMASYGWFYDATTFPNSEKANFKRLATSPGFVVEVTDVSRPPVKVEGSKFPAELVQLMELGKNQVADLLNIVTNPNGANESGNLFMQRHTQRLMGSEYLFDNLAFAKQKLGRLLLALIQKYYTPDRIVRLVRNASSKEQQQIGGQDLAEFSDKEIQDLLETADLAQFDVEVAESKWSPTARQFHFTLLKEMMEAGMPIPPETIFEFADMPSDVKQKLLQSIQQQQQGQASAEQAKADAEIQKTLIAQGLVPPAIAEQYGLQGGAPQPPQDPSQLPPQFTQTDGNIPLT